MTPAACESSPVRVPDAWSAFGARHDLELDFADPDRPALVTRVLENCAAGAPPFDAWQLTLAQRIDALLAVLERTEPGEALNLHLRCSACGEPLEVALEVAALRQHAAAGDASNEVDVTVDEDRCVRMRRPTGADQRRWRTRSYPDAASMVADLVSSLSLSPVPDAAPLTAEQLQRLSSAMEAFDPLVAFELGMCCAACAVESSVAVDLEASVLARLQARQRAMLREVHRLASRYGWTEDEIFAVAPRRRARYLAMIDDDEDGLR